MPELLKSKLLLGILIGLGIFIVLIATFAAGMHAGERKAFHAVGWSNNYPRMFEHPLPPPQMGGGHGVFGKIISNNGSVIVVQGKDNVEQSVLINPSTLIRAGREQASSDQLTADMQVAVFGIPNAEGQIEARLIRLFEKP